MIFHNCHNFTPSTKTLKVNNRDFLYQTTQSIRNKTFHKNTTHKTQQKYFTQKAFKAQKRPRIWKNQNNTLILHLIS